MKLKGRTLLVTGGGSGIGRLMALGAAERGAKVVLWDLHVESGEAVRDEIRANGGVAEAFQVDVSNRHQVAEVGKRTGPVDVVINNAGVISGAPLMELTDEQIERTFDVNVLAHFWVTRAFLPGMIKRGSGTVVTIASAAGMVGVAKQTDYSSSKFAAFGFAESLRMEMRKYQTGVTSFLVCPYYIDTGMFEGVKTRFPLILPILQPEYVAEKVLNGIESGRELLILPWFPRLVPALRLLPVRAFDAVVDFFGINQGMDQFVGRAKDDAKAKVRK